MEYIKHWDGPVVTLLEPSDEETDDLDRVEVHPGDLPFAVEILPFDSPRLEEVLARCAVVSAGISSRVNHLPGVCESIGVPLVYVCELSLPTRLQIIDATPNGSLRKVKQSLWAMRQEWRQVEAIRRAAGIQCNGTPTFDGYGSLTPDSLLFFDTRVTADELIGQDALEARLRQRARPLRLVFSGRLDRIKGVEHLPVVADALRAAGVPFHLDIFGGGVLEQDLRRNIGRYGLTDRVFLHGPVDFHEELLPLLKEAADLFVCCHRQGDPSCTYLETLGCGVPIVGYGNEALAGILGRISAGKTVRMNDPEALAGVIAEVEEDRERLDRWSRCALSFARSHTFEATVKRRMSHLARVAFDARQTERREVSAAKRLLEVVSATRPKRP